MSLRPRLAAALAAVIASGCISTPGLPVEEPPLEPAQVGLQGPAYEPPAANWWLALGDPQLDRLVQEALGHNPGLAGALARLRSAEAQALMTGATGKPQVGLEGSAYREQLSGHYLYPPPYAGSTMWEARLGANLDWNLDFWGRQAALIAQAQRLEQAAALDATGTKLLLSGAITQAYVELVRAVKLEALADQAAAQRGRVLELTRQRARAGLDTSVELRSAEASVALVAVDGDQAKLANESAVHAIAALTGHGSGAYAGITPPTLDLERALVLPQALPADLLARRPDVVAARARVAAAAAGREAAHASFYPNVDLSAFAGFEAVSLDRLLEGGSTSWKAGPAIHLPLFDAGRLRAAYRKASADLDAATAAHNETVLRAVREASDQVSRLVSLERQLDEQGRALDAAEGASTLAEQRYGAGLVNYLTVLNAETQALSARRQRVNLLADRTLARIALLVALGGSFEETTR